MIKDRIVRVKLRKQFREQKPMNYVGKVTAFNDHWVVLEARGVMLTRSQPNNVQIDARANAMMVPRESIESIRILPDNFDLEKMQITTDGAQLKLVVEGAYDAMLGELGEG